MAKYKLLTGMHNEKGVTYIAGAEGQDIIETDKDLTKITNGVHPRFQLISDLEGAEQRVPADVFRAEMRSKTVAELRKFADEEEIDLGEATRKEEIFNIIVGEVELV